MGDLRHGLRSLARQPGFVAVAVLSLSLGIGVNTAIFSALNTLLLRPLAVRDLDRTVYVYDADRANPDRGTSFAAYRQYRDRTDLFSKVTAFSGARPLLLVDEDRRDQVYAELAAADFFSIANVTLRLGRPFEGDVDRASDPRFVAVLSHALWQRRFASDPTIVGRTVHLNAQPFTIVGVAAPGFTGLDSEISADLWIPMATWARLIGEPARLTSDEHWITTVAQLRDDVSLDQAQAALAVAGRAAGSPAGQQTQVRSVRERPPGSASDAFGLAAGAFAVGLLVLAVACMNVANLLMARAAARQREMSVRMALGSSRARLIRLWLSESLLVSLSAGILGLLIASWILDLVVAFKPPAFIGQAEAPTLPLDPGLDARVFAFTFGLSALTAIVVGLVSGFQGSNPGVTRAATSGRADRRFAPGFNVRSLVIASQMALSLILLIPCGLLLRSSLNASTIAPGFSTENVLLLPISTDQAGVRVQKPADFEQRLVARVATLPGVDAATVMDPVPLWFGGNVGRFSIETGQAPPAAERIGFSRVGPGYFETLRLALLGGRDFSPSDNPSAPRVAIVNETMARRFWPGSSALGQRIREGDDAIEIVGIAKDAKYLSLGEAAQPWLYLPLAQLATDNATLSLAVRATGDPSGLRAGIEREVRALVPTWPAFQFRTLDEGPKLQQLLPRLGAMLLGALGAFGLLLAAMGVYGVMAYVVKQRTHEIGIRLALGSPTARVLALVMKQGMAVCLAGAAAGTILALIMTRPLSNLLNGIGAADPLTYTAVPLLLLGVALLACYVPARQVTQVNPLDALRHE